MNSPKPASGVEILDELETVLRSRITEPVANSYSATLLADPQLAARKIMEEAFEVCWELGREVPEPARCASEAADLVFHLIAGLVGAGVPLSDVWTELTARRPAPGGAETVRAPGQERS